MGPARWVRVGLLVLALAAAIVSGAVTGGNAATLRTSYPCNYTSFRVHVAVHIHGPSAIAPGTNVRYTIVGKNCASRTLKHVVLTFSPSPQVVSSPAGFSRHRGRMVLKNVGPHGTFTVRLVLNFPPAESLSGYDASLEAQVKAGSRISDSATKNVYVN